MIHAVWNIIGAIILGGVSLADDYPSLFSMAPAGNALISDGEYMIEGSVVVTVVNIVLMLVFFFRCQRASRCDTV